MAFALACQASCLIKLSCVRRAAALLGNRTIGREGVGAKRRGPHFSYFDALKILNFLPFIVVRHMCFFIVFALLVLEEHVLGIQAYLHLNHIYDLSVLPHVISTTSCVILTPTLAN